MKYRNCPKCQAQNRAADEKCYSCDAIFPALDEPDSPSPSEAVAVLPRNRDRSSTWKDGLISGLKVGAITGGLWGIYGAFFGTALASSMSNDAAVLGGVGAIVFATIFVRELIFCAVIGLIAGALNILCYKYDAMKAGSAVGVLYALINFSLLGVFWAAAYGSMAGLMCSHAEKVRRGQYSDL